MTCGEMFLQYFDLINKDDGSERYSQATRLSSKRGGKKTRIPNGSALSVLSGGRKRMQPKGSSLLAPATAMVRLGTTAARTATTGLLRSTPLAMPGT